MQKAERKRGIGRWLAVACVLTGFTSCNERPPPGVVVDQHGAFVDPGAHTGDLPAMLTGRTVRTTNTYLSIDGAPVHRRIGAQQFEHDVVLDANEVFHTFQPSLPVGRPDPITVVRGPSQSVQDNADKGLGLRVNNSLLRAIAMSMERTGLLDIENLIPEDFEQDIDVAGIGIGEFKIDDVDSDRTSIVARFRDGGFDFRYLVFGLDVGGTAHIPGPNCDVELVADPLIIAVEFDVTATNNGRLKMVVDDVDIDGIGLDVDVDCGFGSPVNLVPDDILDVDDLVQDKIEDGIEGFVDSKDLEDILDELQEFDAGGAVSQQIDFAVDAFLRNVNEDSTGATLKADVGVSATSSLFELLNSYAISESFPGYGKETAAGNAYGIGVGLSTTAINQALTAATDQGLLKQALELRDASGEPIDSLVGSLLDAVGATAANGSTTLEVSPQLAPVVTGNAGPGGAMLDVYVGHANVILRTGQGGLLFRALVNARVGLDASFAGNNGGLVLDVTPGANEVLVLNNQSLVSDEIIEAFVGAFLTQGLPDFVEGLTPLALPPISAELSEGTFISLRLDGAEASVDGTHLGAYFEPTVQLCIDDNGEVKTGTNLSEVTCYRDDDDDGYPENNKSVNVERCNNPWCPPAYTKNSPDNVGRDCFDLDDRVRPDQNQFFQKENHNGDFDYNCDGEEERKWTDVCGIDNSNPVAPRECGWRPFGIFPVDPQEGPDCGEPASCDCDAHHVFKVQRCR